MFDAARSYEAVRLRYSNHPKGGRGTMPDVVFDHERSPDYRIIAVTGIWGGLVPSGQVMFDLVTELIRNPNRVRHDVTQDGKLGPEKSREPSERIILRYSQVGVMVTPDVAERMGQWLLDRAKQARERQMKSQGAS